MQTLHQALLRTELLVQIRNSQEFIPIQLRSYLKQTSSDASFIELLIIEIIPSEVKDEEQELDLLDFDYIDFAAKYIETNLKLDPKHRIYPHGLTWLRSTLQLFEIDENDDVYQSFTITMTDTTLYINRIFYAL